MQTFKKHAKTTFKKFRKKLCVVGLVVAMMIQTLALPCLAAWNDVSSLWGGGANLGNIVNGIGRFDSDETIEQLKKDMLAMINKDLIKQIEDYELTGEVGAIVVFSDDSLINSYTGSKLAQNMTFSEFTTSSDAESIKNRIYGNQTTVLDKLVEKELIFDVKHRYCNIMDGAFVHTTYENIEALCNAEGVERVIISNSYKPAIAVENPVYVYDTGIFNSSNIAFTGKGTIVAVLDTGCDYTHSAFSSYTVQSPLYDRDDIAALLDKTVAYSYDTTLEAREVYYGNITGNKIAFGYDYADKDPDIMPTSSEHGTHVAGVIAGKDDTITGVAIDAQLAIMKVFSDYKQGAEDGDILAALEDSVALGVDAINMSLGSSCGFTREVDEQFKNDIYDSIEAAGISLVVAANNDYSSGFGSEDGNTNKTHNPDSATVGAPGTYNSALCVASINGNKDKYMLANGNREVFFLEAYNMGAEEYNFFDMLGITAENPYAEYEYVTIPGIGMAINYSGLEMKGKIALVRRGENSFEEKVQFAYEAGAAAVIIYNNVFGDITMTVGNDLKIPVVSIGKDDGDVLASQPTGKIAFDFNNVAGPFMSAFSSWGPNPDLSLKPEITAHGGNIWSAIPGGGYEKLSGTSMASPNMCGIVVLARQYVKEKYPDMTATEVRDLVNQLCMSTATIALDKFGNPYSPRKQGAGIGDIEKATTTPAYLYVDGIGKTKLELGDDPSRNGVYTMSVNLKNISDAAVSYTIGNIAMTESVSTSEPEYVAEKAYLLSNAAQYTVEGGTYENGVVTVQAGQTAKVTVTLTLSSEDKIYINTNFANGMYVEGFLTFDNTDANGVDLNAPFLAFYGDWGEAPIFDLDFYEVETEAHNDAIDDDDKIKADYYATTPLGTYYYDYILPLGSYLYKMDEDEYEPIPAVREHAALSYYTDCISGMYGVFTGLLRGAKEMNIQIVDTATGEVVWSETEYNCSKAHYSGVQYPYISRWDLPMVDIKNNTIFGSNNTKYEVTMSAKLDWDGENRNSNDTYSFSFYIDYEAPTVTDATFRTEYDKAREENRYYVDIMVYDNHYAMAINPVLVYDFVDYDGETKKTYSGLTEYPIPVYQENIGEVTKVTLEITDYLDIITSSHSPDGITVYLNDYALNSNVCFIPFPNTEDSEDLEFLTESIDLDIHETFDLTSYLVAKDSTVAAEPDYLKGLQWISSDESVVAINNGRIEALKSGTATVSVTGTSWYTTQVTGETSERIPIYKTIEINVSDQVADDPKSSLNAQIEKLDFSYYKTLFAFNSDIDYSEIGRTDSINYFGGNNSISCYPSEQVQLFYNLEPWNLSKDRYTLTWTSSNPKAATVDENGVVTAQEEGRARITLQITIDGKTSLLAARCSVEVKSEFIIENRTLVAYKGKGGDVVIPDDEGIMYIGKYAFCHFTIDHEMEVEKDENGYYDMDLKKTPLENTTVTSVVIPKGVEKVDKYAFANCKALESVTLPEDCTEVAMYAFAECDVLKNVNFDKVSVIGDYAFYKCKSLTCEDIGGANLSGVYNIGMYGFAETRLSEVALTNLGRCGVGAFSGCDKLTTVTLGKNTRVAEKMFENTALESITVRADSVSNYAFQNCDNLKTVVFESDLTYLGEGAFYDCKLLESVTFQAGCEKIGSGAFSKCPALESMTLPTGKIVLGNGVFSSSALEELKFADTTEIVSCGVSIFENITDLDVDITNSNVYVLNDNAIYTKDGSTLVYVIPVVGRTTFTVPAAVTTIADGAFSSNYDLRTVLFADGSLLEHVGVGAFANCVSLSKVEFPNRTITIGDSAFFNTKSLYSINLDMVASIGMGAFENSILTEVSLPTTGVTIGNAAFYGCSNLTKVTLGEGAVIGQYAFLGTPIKSVEFLGGGVTVSDHAFVDCMKLTTFDFADVSGKIGKYAFLNCILLKAVDAPEITEIGEGAFSSCASLTTFKADKLEIVGKFAFAPYFENQSGDPLTSFTAPLLSKIGDGAFYLCNRLTEIDLSNLTEIGMNAFAKCTALTTVTLSDKLEELADYAFGECTSLTNIDISNIVRFGAASLYGVQLPAHLELPKAEYLASNAFIEGEVNYIESVTAPNLIEMSNLAFAGCKKLTSVSAPKLESIGYGAFLSTAIEEFEITSALKFVDSSVFESNKTLKGFYATVNGEKVYNAEFDNVMIKDGVLYTVTEKGYILNCYPAAKADETFTVADGTIRIEFGAAIGNTFVKTVILPGSLKYIGNFAFYECTSLEKVVFNSYYAPVLEGSMNGTPAEITDVNRGDYACFDELFKYDYFYKMEEKLGIRYWYNTFITEVLDAEPITYVIPQNSNGYDSKIYKAFFNASADENSGTVMGAYAIAFVEAVKKLPEVVDRFDKALVDAAIIAYNALDGRDSEKAFIDSAFIDKYFAACSEYNVSETTFKIGRLFTMENCKYSFDTLKDARASYLALSDAERALVPNAAIIDAKVAELSAAMGKEINFSLSYEDHIDPVVDDPTGDPNGTPDPEPKGLDTWVIIVIVAASVVVVAAGTVGVIIFIKKKRA